MTAASEQRIRDSLSAAEDVPDALDGLVARATSDPGAPFEPDVLTALVARKRANPGGFERLRAELKSCGVRVTALDKAMQGLDKEAGSGGSGGDRKPRQADILLAIAASAKLFHTPDGTGYADLQINGHQETWPIRGKIFKRWLAHRFYEDMDGAPSSEALHRFVC